MKLYPRVECTAVLIRYRNCNVFRKLQIIVEELRMRGIDLRRKKSRRYAVLVLRKFLSLRVDYSPWIYCPRCQRRMWTGPDHLSEHARRYVDVFVDNCDCGSNPNPFCGCSDHGGVLAIKQCEQSES